MRSRTRGMWFCSFGISFHPESAAACLFSVVAIARRLPLCHFQSYLVAYPCSLRTYPETHLLTQQIASQAARQVLFRGSIHATLVLRRLQRSLRRNSVIFCFRSSTTLNRQPDSWTKRLPKICAGSTQQSFLCLSLIVLCLLSMGLPPLSQAWPVHSAALVAQPRRLQIWCESCWEFCQIYQRSLMISRFPDLQGLEERNDEDLIKEMDDWGSQRTCP